MTRAQSVRQAVRPAAVCVAVTVMMCGVVSLQSQQLIGYVKADDADVTGATDVLDGQAVLAGSVGVTAKSHTAVITLGRGGLARVCQTSALHMTQSKGTGLSDAGSTAPLLFSLDRGAVEIRMNGLANDSIMTPDLRMTVRANGPLDVRLRVARNGDTCVENHGGAAPSLAVSDPFGESMYELLAGQHVLFEHGDVHSMVDHETESCGCPAESGATVAEALLAPGGQKLGAKTPTPPTAVEQHPFPTAVSEGLTTALAQPEANPAVPQVTAELRYNGAVDQQPAQPVPAQTMTVLPSSATPASLGTVMPPSEPARKPAAVDDSQNRDLVHVIGHFFRKIFGH